MRPNVLFTPLKVGAVTASNRIFMAPLTRLRCIEPGDIPTPLMADYYEQRASSGLIIAEATQVSLQAKGYSGSPGIYSQEQIHAWKVITDRVHAANGHIALQLWHTGRMSHSSLQPGGAPPVAPSAINSGYRTSLRDEHGRTMRVNTTTPRELEIDEIPRIVDDFHQAVANAREAGFDMVELHGAHGYLLHQFYCPNSNIRTDRYGGSIENRARFTLEVVDAACAAWSPDRIGIRLSPIGTFQMAENGPDEENNTLYLVEELAKRGIAYIHFSEPDWVGGRSFTESFRRQVRQRFPNVIIGSGGYDIAKAETLVSQGLIDAVAFGRSYIANPDLVERIKCDAPINTPKREFFYGGGAEGYIDYPTLKAQS